jgi:predicted Rossmann fold flavoprotein
LSIDLKPALSEQELDARILRDFSKFTNKDFVNSLFELLPRKIIPHIVTKCGINPHQKVNTITKEQRKKLVSVIKSFDLTVISKAGFDEAVITSGGVNLNEINAKTMESKFVKGLYFTGEVLDLDANTGGYNLQIAFSTGALAGMHAAWEE